MLERDRFPFVVGTDPLMRYLGASTKPAADVEAAADP
jgi:hypothetical protein